MSWVEKIWKVISVGVASLRYWRVQSFEISCGKFILIWNRCIPLLSRFKFQIEWASGALIRGNTSWGAFRNTTFIIPHFPVFLFRTIVLIQPMVLFNRKWRVKSSAVCFYVPYFCVWVTTLSVCLPINIIFFRKFWKRAPNLNKYKRWQFRFLKGWVY